jgi:hypothetical protein
MVLMELDVQGNRFRQRQNRALQGHLARGAADARGVRALT